MRRLRLFFYVSGQKVTKNAKTFSWQFQHTQSERICLVPLTAAHSTYAKLYLPFYSCGHESTDKQKKMLINTSSAELVTR